MNTFDMIKIGLACPHCGATWRHKHHSRIPGDNASWTWEPEKLSTDQNAKAANPAMPSRAARPSKERAMLNDSLWRYEYPEDRFVFWRWVDARWHGNRKPYWWFDKQRERLIIELQDGDRTVECMLSKVELDLSLPGWRWMVAQAVRHTRHALWHNKK